MGRNELWVVEYLLALLTAGVFATLSFPLVEWAGPLEALLLLSAASLAWLFAGVRFVQYADMADPLRQRLGWSDTVN